MIDKSGVAHALLPLITHPRPITTQHNTTHTFLSISVQFQNGYALETEEGLPGDVAAHVFFYFSSDLLESKTPGMFSVGLQKSEPIGRLQRDINLGQCLLLSYVLAKYQETHLLWNIRIKNA